MAKKIKRLYECQTKIKTIKLLICFVYFCVFRKRHLNLTTCIFAWLVSFFRNNNNWPNIKANQKFRLIINSHDCSQHILLLWCNVFFWKLTYFTLKNCYKNILLIILFITVIVFSSTSLLKVLFNFNFSVAHFFYDLWTKLKVKY